MKLKNKKTGEIVKLVGYVNTADDRMFFRFEDNIDTYKKEYTSLAELNEEWEDYEEPKVFWYIYGDQVLKAKCDGVIEDMNKPIGNYFETKEEAEKAVEKLKALKRLKDKGFRFDGWSSGLGKNAIYTIFWSGNDGEFDLRKDLDICFGGEE